MPDYLPPYSGVFTDPQGTVWVQLSAPGDAETWLRRVGNDSQVLKDVRIPVGLRVFEVGSTYVLGAYEEPSGEPHVAMYPIP
jgi:hypothetical protein